MMRQGALTRNEPSTEQRERNCRNEAVCLDDDNLVHSGIVCLPVFVDGTPLPLVDNVMPSYGCSVQLDLQEDLILFC
jgi:hypothetical protein